MVWVDEIIQFFQSLTITAYRLDGTPFSVTPQLEGIEGENTADARDDTPKIVFFDYDILPNNALRRSGVEKVTKTDTDGDGILDEAEIKGSPEPHIIYFQVELITFWREDDVALRTAWMKKFPIRGHIDVTDPQLSDTVRLFYEQVAYVPLDDDERDATEGRMYRKVYRYGIWTELDSSVAATYKLAKTRIVTAKLKE